MTDRPNEDLHVFLRISASSLANIYLREKHFEAKLAKIKYTFYMLYISGLTFYEIHQRAGVVAPRADPRRGYPGQANNLGPLQADFP
jgi:hypothetical protein